MYNYKDFNKTASKSRDTKSLLSDVLETGNKVTNESLSMILHILATIVVNGDNENEMYYLEMKKYAEFALAGAIETDDDNITFSCLPLAQKTYNSLCDILKTDDFYNPKSIENLLYSLSTLVIDGESDYLWNCVCKSIDDIISELETKERNKFSPYKG